jgi:hypothetical protein
MNLNKAKIFGEIGTILLLIVFLVYISGIILPSSFLHITTSKESFQIYKESISDTGLIFIGIAIIYIAKSSKNKKILTFLVLVSFLFVLEIITSIILKRASTALSHILGQSTLIFPILKSIFIPLMFREISHVLNKKGFLIAGILFLIENVFIIPGFIIGLSIGLRTSTKFLLYTNIYNTIIALGILFLLINFAKLKSNSNTNPLPIQN